MERWLSGRKHRTRNAAYLYGYRGFESHPLRQYPVGSLSNPQYPIKSAAKEGVTGPRPYQCISTPPSAIRVSPWTKSDSGETSQAMVCAIWSAPLEVIHPFCWS